MDCASVDAWARLVGNLGFPIFVAVFLLLRVEPAIARLIRTLDTLAASLARPPQ